MPDHLQYLQDIRRHHLPIESRRHNGRNTYDLTGFAISMVVGELKEYGIPLSGCGHLLSRIDLDALVSSPIFQYHYFLFSLIRFQGRVVSFPRHGEV